MARALRMLSDKELTEVLSVQNLKLPAQPRVVDIKFADYEGSSGEDSLDIYVVLEDRTPPDGWTWARVQPIYDTVRSALSAAGESRYPYFTAGTREQYERRYSYDPETDE